MLLWWISYRLRDALLEGDVFLMFLIWYPLGRFLIEFLRPDAWMAGPIAVAQIFAAISVIAATLFLVFRPRTRSPQGSDVAEAEGQAAP